MRKEKNGWPQKVKVGYGRKASRRGLHPRGLVERFVRNEADLEGLDPKMHIVRLSARLGEKRRLILLGRVRTLNVHVANPGKEEARPVGEEAAPAESTVSGKSSGRQVPAEGEVEGEALPKRQGAPPESSEVEKLGSDSTETGQ